MSEAEKYLNEAWVNIERQGLTPEQLQDQVRAVQEDMSEGLRQSVAQGWLTQQEADEMEYNWMKSYCPGQGYQDRTIPDIQGRDI